MNSTLQDSSLQPGAFAPDGAQPAEAVDLLPLYPKPAPSNEADYNELDDNPRYQVFRLNSRFLRNERLVRVYLPEAYLHDSERRFPVLYLHDGQNLFDPRTAYLRGHTWRAHSTADRLTREGRTRPVILVGLDNTGIRRMSEYTPTRDPMRGGGEGELYGKLLVEELRPALASRFRVEDGPENTGLGGSSLGGLISLALGLEHPDVFGRLAVMSPSLWWNNRSVFEWLAQRAPLKTSKIRPRFAPPPPEYPHPRLWLDIGTHEGLRHVRDADMLHRRLIDRGWRDGIDLRYLKVPGGLHNEDAWANRFDQMLTFLFPPQKES
ncbi:alpha/beta hydrolase [Bryocella elongata]|uniref:alpha/beta hydrolase n=1 Tax=Bryocella elongata TaxID=863522 RepID=UPI001EEAF063|nr:alpha/beta hydrolase-fold protein [Bryocella elongata]